jgi:trimethylguanosine synthase
MPVLVRLRHVGRVVKATDSKSVGISRVGSSPARVAFFSLLHVIFSTTMTKKKQRVVKRKKREAYWVEDSIQWCPADGEGEKDDDDASSDSRLPLAVLITRADLEDDFFSHTNHRIAATVADSELLAESVVVAPDRMLSRHCKSYSVHCHETAARRPRVFQNNGYVELPHGDCGDGILNPFEPTVVPHKYWAQRHRLFTKFDDGVQLDRDGWFSVTPQVIAEHIARRLVGIDTTHGASRTSDCGLVVMDPFAGVGGNVIALALRPEVELVVAADLDAERLRMCLNNCRVYQVPIHKVLFVVADANWLLSQYQGGQLQSTGTTTAETSQALEDYVFVSQATDAKSILPLRLDRIFMSPPWGGPEYLNVKSFCVRQHLVLDNGAGETYSGVQLLQRAMGAVEWPLAVTNTDSAVDATVPDTAATGTATDNNLEPQPLLQPRVAILLPRNTHGGALAQAVSPGRSTGVLELEQNMVNGKFKTITAYL